MRTYARLLGGVVMELFTTSADITTLFPAAIQWVDVSAVPGIQAGWVQNGTTFAAPAAQTPTVPVPTLASVQAQLTALQQQVTALAAAGAH
jgi:hypothetical protein